MNVLVVLGHPRTSSLGADLAGAYRKGASEAGTQVRLLSLAELEFEPDVLQADPLDQPLEPDLAEAQALLAWANHLVLVYPTWWGTVPARMKGFLDRILLPGFAFTERDGGGFAPLLGGRTAELLTTMDTPGWVYRWIYGAPGHRALTRATLGFCGIDTVRVSAFGPVNTSSPSQRSEWLECARELGARLDRGARTPLQEGRHRVGKWLMALRLQFYPVTVLGYILGARSAAREAGFHWEAFGFGLACVLGVKAATVLTNDIMDRPSDEANRNWSLFTGGGRSLVEKRLSEGEMWKGTGVALGVAVLSVIGLLAVTPGVPWAVLAVLGCFGALALGYTLPPMKWSHRGLGEVAVAVTHGVGVVLWGFVVQGGAWSAPLPWLLGLLIGLSVLPAIVLAGIPDRSADAAAGKRTLVVRMGTGRAAGFALGATGLAALAATLSLTWPPLVGITRELPLIAVPHALLLAVLLLRYRAAGAAEQRIDGLIGASLLFILWFVVIPVWNVG